MNWTAQTTCLSGYQITALCPADMQLTEFMRRLMADDRCWKRRPIIKKQSPSIQNHDLFGGPEIMHGGIVLLILQ